MFLLLVSNVQDLFSSDLMDLPECFNKPKYPNNFNSDLKEVPKFQERAHLKKKKNFRNSF